MASGLLGTADLSATTNTVIFTGTASTVTTCNVSVCNRNSSTITFRLAYEDGSSGTPSNDEYFEYDVSLGPNDSYERTGIVVTAGDSIIAYASGTGVSVQAWGFERPV